MGKRVLRTALLSALLMVAVPALAQPAAAQASRAGKISSAAVNPVDPRCRTAGKVICLDKRARVMRAMKDGKVLFTLSTRFGRKGMGTREGTFRVYRKGRNHMSTTYHVRMPYSLFFSGGQAVHYSADFARNGYRIGSHGCANLRSRSGAQRLYDWAPIGTKVVVYRG